MTPGNVPKLEGEAFERRQAGGFDVEVAKIESPAGSLLAAVFANNAIQPAFQAAGHISETGKKLLGEKTAEAKTFLEEGRALLLSDGWAGLCDHIGATLTKTPELSGHAALGELTGYFAAHSGRLNYAHRLHTGQSIGSGMVEGAAKNLIGKRMKQTGARWVVSNADAMAALCSLNYSDHWGLYWASPN